jgi:hypothetical protein
MAYQRSPSRAPNDRLSEYAVADDARAEIRKLHDAQLDNQASKWRYKAPPASGRRQTDKY